MKRQRVALIENQLNTCPWRTRAYAVVTCPLAFVLNRYTNKDRFVLWVRKWIPTQKVVPCVTCKTVSRCVVLCFCPSPPPLIKCSPVSVWNVFSVGTCVKELWATRFLNTPGASSEESWVAAWCLSGSCQVGGFVGLGFFSFPVFFFCVALLPAKLSQGSPGVTWEPAWSLWVFWNWPLLESCCFLVCCCS